MIVESLLVVSSWLCLLVTVDQGDLVAMLQIEQKLRLVELKIHSNEKKSHNNQYTEYCNFLIRMHLEELINQRYIQHNVLFLFKSKVNSFSFFAKALNDCQCFSYKKFKSAYLMNGLQYKVIRDARGKTIKKSRKVL